jgi:hypothetical protein
MVCLPMRLAAAAWLHGVAPTLMSPADPPHRFGSQEAAPARFCPIISCPKLEQKTYTAVTFQPLSIGYYLVESKETEESL